MGRYTARADVEIQCATIIILKNGAQLLCFRLQVKTHKPTPGLKCHIEIDFLEMKLCG